MNSLMTARDAAALLWLSERTLDRLRNSGGGPRYIKVRRSVRYRQGDVDAWLNARVVSNTSEGSGR